MDKTMKLVLWQRITTAFCVFAVIVELIYAHSYAVVVREQKTTIQRLQLEVRSQDRTISDRDERLKQYEAKFEPLAAKSLEGVKRVNQGKSGWVYITRDPDGMLVAR